MSSVAPSQRAKVATGIRVVGFDVWFLRGDGGSSCS